MKPYIHEDVVFVWNLEKAVGKGGANSVLSDVSYIQWYYVLGAAHPEGNPARQAVYRQVKVTGTCTGLDDDPLVKAITIHQQSLKHPIVDGRISAIPGGASGGLRVGGGKAFFVVRLAGRFAYMFPNIWPRLDLIPGCPASVAKAVQDIIPRIPSG